MTIANGQQILAPDLDAIWSTALGTLRTRTNDNNKYLQFNEVFTFNAVNNSTAEYLRTIVYVPRTDVILRGIRLYCCSTTTGITATLTIPAQIAENGTIVGGNIKSTLTLTATSGATVLASGGFNQLSTNELFTFLAGDNIDLVVSTNNATAANVIIVLMLETVLTG